MNNENITKTYFTIGEVSELLGVAPSLIRFWEKEFTVFKPLKTEKGTRKYTQKHIQLLTLIHHLVKVKGYTLQGAADHIRQQSNTDETAEIVEKLKRVKSFLETIKSGLKA
jgi:DNA-binding transcriptional MerR regulator